MPSDRVGAGCDDERKRKEEDNVEFCTDLMMATEAAGGVGDSSDDEDAWFGHEERDEEAYFQSYLAAVERHIASEDKAPISNLLMRFNKS